MFSSKPHGLYKVPLSIICIVHGIMIIHCIYNWKTDHVQFVPLVISCIFFMLLDIKCFMCESLEYLICVFMLHILKVLILLFYSCTRTPIVAILFWNSMLKILSYVILIYCYSPLFRQNLYFKYTWGETRPAFLFEESFLQAFIEIKIGCLIFHKFSCFLYKLERGVCAFSLYNIMNLTALISIYIHMGFYAKTSNMAVYFCIFSWIGYILCYEIVPFTAYFFDPCGSCNIMVSFYRNLHILNLIVVVLILVYRIFTAYLNKDAPANIVSYSLLRRAIE
ncbi:hypothetical protein NEPAR06_0206 [Nematocida parisii]|uniref:Uncharacterized protein n=1 Tax=Nematocida parisii (strain ERTm3) TaxID=935791 RepID=I3EDC6_NEMP3|nr:uncharacterized protein NEPG_00603 [Nematocida parisii ERTm1]EIJ87223.1 hypothetical protein NEQG_02558 [Nematocida parisii ERTm3]KAI5143171.1 hypothetical protein NEPAR07_0533 [Nematocida parisii]EIJ95078.1 hypothetical protein NEPG_00603 [Nematocida parisii ERTm1]KAI5153128.1 hypothetical protein NEPAR06_0206 [Nematocida parisii]KAI5156401.1 hypothetical protein NEPAR05_0531 [Nematocida parisii]|eukprot:XP_013058434.1 hypothetical protein NEPG_00603 [Nematocida parisii ERTm1]